MFKSGTKSFNDSLNVHAVKCIGVPMTIIVILTFHEWQAQHLYMASGTCIDIYVLKQSYTQNDVASGI